ncbi:amidohydrolase [Ktedonosporobacter rubrisoli]|uniref:Amidohydrolase n=1 Tax=Ktedonosporobacter rubrisoli TaxID=2509675 RepID=A0A4P6K4K6_KTERU|nr:amidohydrolase family protein [Ktedonosporobacter rubrisoli]QBD83169.1 amidohydrolase [Ktedonosporobacter rubrisoli]
MHSIGYLQQSVHGDHCANEITNSQPQLLIRGCNLLSPHAQTRLLYNQDILVAGTRIQAVGPSGTLDCNPFRIERIISGEGLIAMAGLVNAHTHSLENMLKATSPSLPLELWLVPLFVDTVKWSPRFVYLSALLGAIEMLKTGTTAVLDHLWTVAGVDPEYLNATMQAYNDVGIRAAVAPAIEDQDLVLEAGIRRGLAFPSHPFIDRFAHWPAIDAQVRALEQFIATWHNADDGRLRCLVGPSGIHWCSPALLQSCLELSERYQTGIHLHAVETELQAAIIHEMLGQGGIAYLDKMGVLKRGTSLAHAIWLDQGDLELLAGSATTVVHNPISNLRLGSGRFPLAEAFNHGVSVALGSDGSASNDTQNMFGVLKLTGLVHNQPDKDYKKWPHPDEILDAATHGGARALDMAAELGDIAPGKLADFVLLDMNAAPFLPLRDPYLHLVYCENGGSVNTVVVNGKVVVEQGLVTTVDEQEIHQEIRHYCATHGFNPAESIDITPNTNEVLTLLDRLRRHILENGDV